MMLRSLAKRGLYEILHSTGLSRMAVPQRGISFPPVVLGYHRVVDDYPAYEKRSIPGMVVSRLMFEQQLDWLACRFEVRSLDALVKFVEHPVKTKKPVAAVTFDDGYRDNFDHAFPILLRKGIPAAIFITTGLIDSQESPIHDRLYSLVQRAFNTCGKTGRNVEQIFCHGGITSQSFDRASAHLSDPFGAAQLLLSKLRQVEIRKIIETLESILSESSAHLENFRPLTWEMISKMSEAGITFGSHTRTHALLANEDSDRIAQETFGSRKDLETRLGKAIYHFAYPGGSFNKRTIQSVAAAGYRYAYTTCTHRNSIHPLLTIPRRTVWEATSRTTNGAFSPAIMSCELNGFIELMGDRCAQSHN